MRKETLRNRGEEKTGVKELVESGARWDRTWEPWTGKECEVSQLKGHGKNTGREGLVMDGTERGGAGTE